MDQVLLYALWAVAAIPSNMSSQSLSSDLRAQQYLLQNTQDWNNFLPANPYITGEHRQLQNLDPQVEDVHNLF